MNDPVEIAKPAPANPDFARQSSPGTPAREAKIEVIVASTVDQLEPLRAFWEKTNLEGDLDFDFYLMVLAALAATPYVLAVIADGQPTALLIGRLETTLVPLQLGYKTFGRLKLRQIMLLRSGFIGDHSAQNAGLLFSRLMLALKQGTADRALFGGIGLESDLCRLCRDVPSFLCRDNSRMVSDHWKAVLPATWDDFLKQKSSKLRGELRRLLRKLEEEHPGRVKYHVYERPDQLEACFQALETVAAKSYQRGLGAGFMNSALDRQIVQLAAARGWLMVCVVAIDEVPLGFWAGRLYKGTMFADWTGYDPAYQKFEAGTVAFCKMVEGLCQAKATGFDFGCGTSLYKQRLGDRNDAELWVGVYAPTLRAVWANLLTRTLYGFAKLAKLVVQKLGIFDRLKRFWRQRLAARKG